MVSVTVNTGPITATRHARDIPREQWNLLIGARRYFLEVTVAADCRKLLEFIQEAEAERMWEAARFVDRATGELRPYTDLDDLVRNGLGMEPQLVEWAVEGLKTLSPDKPVPFKVAVKKGQEVALRSKAVEALSKHGANQHGKRTLPGNVHTDQQGNSFPYLVGRIKRDHPDIAARLDAGEFTSVKAAAREAGIPVTKTISLTKPKTVAQHICAQGREYAQAVREEIDAWLVEGGVIDLPKIGLSMAVIQPTSSAASPVTTPNCWTSWSLGKLPAFAKPPLPLVSSRFPPGLSRRKPSYQSLMRKSYSTSGIRNYRGTRTTAFCVPISRLRGLLGVLVTKFTSRLCLPDVVLYVP